MVDLYPHPTHETSALRRQLTPAASAAFADFSRAVFADGALSTKMKQLIAGAVAHVTQCPYCIRGTPKVRCIMVRPARKSWRPSGWLRKCGRVVRSPIRQSPSPLCVRRRATRNQTNRERTDMATRTSRAEWQGDLRSGHGQMDLGSGAFHGTYSFGSRFEQAPGTNPEELLGAALAGCFAMAFKA